MRVYKEYSFLGYANVTLIFSSFTRVSGAVSSTPVRNARKGPAHLVTITGSDSQHWERASGMVAASPVVECWLLLFLQSGKLRLKLLIDLRLLFAQLLCGLCLNLSVLLLLSFP